MTDIEKCRITYYPSPVLAKPAKPVEEINDNIRQLVEKMTEIMFEKRGMGLAAPQAGVSLRLFIVSLEPPEGPIKVFINPAVTPTGELETIEEGCLSAPSVPVKIRRSQKCTVTATDLDGNEFTEEAEGLYARVIQHEYDHIEGVTIITRMGTTAKIMHRRQLKRLAENYKESTE